MTLEETLAQIKPLTKNAMDVAAKRWDSTETLHSLGKMEKLVIQIAGITGNPDMKIQNVLWYQCVQIMGWWKKV